MEKLENSVVKPSMVILIDGVENRMISVESEVTMDKYIDEFNAFIKDNTGLDSTEEEKDQLYANGQSYIISLRNDLRDLKMSFYFNRRQYQFLTDLILKKMEYDVNTVFIAIELSDLMINMKKIKFEDDKEVNFSEMTPTELTYLYHIISTYKVKGLRDESHHFVNVLRRIGDMSKIIKYYDTYKEDLTSKLTNWAANMGGGELENELDPMGSELQSDPYTDGKEL